MDRHMEQLMEVVVKALNRQRWPLSMITDALTKLSKVGISTYVKLDGESDYIISWTTFVEISEHRTLLENHPISRGTVTFRVPKMYRGVSDE